MAKKKTSKEEAPKATPKKKLPVFTGQELANLKSGDYYPLEAEKVYIVFGGLNLRREGVSGIRLSDLIDFIS